MQTIQRHIINQAKDQAAEEEVIFADAIFIDARRDEEQDDFMFEMHLI